LGATFSNQRPNLIQQRYVQAIPQYSNYHSLPTPYCSAGMLVRLYICTLSCLRCFKSPTSRTILWLLEHKNDE